ncbi:translation initiation factor IF-2 subunit beta [Halolamina litorea]|uniref:Translation initiation factor IF-2 subunit beta n=1 Tax=Halolamina litorea TaxID=1515593 RepID=A0ABD6BUX6_9EURY|nr:translation initiation factor IF-2 subunit beta [Halolamina litorea]
MEYETKLDRALELVPELGGSDERLSVPDPTAQKDGAFTRLTNLKEIADALSREEEHLHREIQSELGTAGQLGDGRSRYNGTFSQRDFQAAIDSYIEEFVRCSECGLPDTRLVNEDGTMMLRCEACGAFRPVTKQSTSSSQQTTTEITEGETYEVEITDTGRKGDGVAKRGDYTMFVTGAEEGETVRARVNNVSGNLVFARKVN